MVRKRLFAIYETPFYAKHRMFAKTGSGQKHTGKGLKPKVMHAFFAGLHVSKFETGEAAAPHYDATLPGGDTAPADHNWSVRREGTNR